MIRCVPGRIGAGSDDGPASHVEMLLRKGIGHYGGQVWTGKHGLWLCAHDSTTQALRLGYETALDARSAGYVTYFRSGTSNRPRAHSR